MGENFRSKFALSKVDFLQALAVPFLDAWILSGISVVAFYLAVSGVDDLFVDVVWIVAYIRRRLDGNRMFAPPTEDELNLPERRVAIVVPLWQEQPVIRRMLAHNAAAIRYRNYAFFCGGYPNDEPTLAAVREMEGELPNVHLSVCPHNGPTSKADCLNAIYDAIRRHEARTGEHFDLIVTHDAEDIIHPDALRWMNFYSREYDFIQIPVLALQTSCLAFTHGVYCDEFAEFQTRDLPARDWMGGFIPSAGVGTAYSRQGLEKLVRFDSKLIFEPDSLTEDYENGRRFRDLGLRQIFIPPIRSKDGWMATREFFPQAARDAIRQRTRWVTGISLQGWQRHGWQGGWRQVYWVWRDRKGLIGSPLSLATNLATVYCLVTRMWQRTAPPDWVAWICAATLGLQMWRMAVRMACVSRVYGWRFASLAPVRALYANFINAIATVRALKRFTVARFRGEGLAWLKTSHSYPNREGLVVHQRGLGEILVSSGLVKPDQLSMALETQPADRRIGEHLIDLGLLSENALYQALSLQQGLPLGVPAGMRIDAIRILPARLMRNSRVIPLRVSDGRLHVVSPEVPDDALQAALREHTALDIRFHLVTPTQFAVLSKRTV